MEEAEKNTEDKIICYTFENNLKVNNDKSITYAAYTYKHGTGV